MTPRQRVRRVRMAGASCSTDRAVWAKVVDKAVAYGDEKQNELCLDAIREARLDPRARRSPFEVLAPGYVAVPAQTILDIEREFAELEEHKALIQELVDTEEISAAIRDRLRARLEVVQTTLRRRIAAEETKN